jgi:iron complex transport system permease protein
MVVVSLIVFVPMFFKSSRGVFFVLLLGVVIGQLASAINTYLQLLINPDEFSVVQSKMFASFEFPNMYLSLIASILIGLCILAIPRPSQLDVVHLGRDNAIGLGIDYRVVCIRCLIIVSVLVSVSTVVVGPLMFLGVLVANLSYMVLRTYKHIYLIPMCVLISGVLIVATQYFKTHIYNFGITISVIINFVGGLFFLYLLLISRKKLT